MYLPSYFQHIYPNYATYFAIITITSLLYQLRSYNIKRFLNSTHKLSLLQTSFHVKTALREVRNAKRPITLIPNTESRDDKNKTGKTENGYGNVLSASFSNLTGMDSQRWQLRVLIPKRYQIFLYKEENQRHFT